MATMDAVFSMSDVAPTTASLGATTSTAALSLGGGSLWAYVATQDSHIRFGISSVGAADATFFRIPANTIFLIDMNRNLTHIRVFNPSASTSTYHIVPMLRS